MEGESTAALRKMIHSELMRAEVQTKIRDALMSVSQNEIVAPRGDSGAGGGLLRHECSESRREQSNTLEVLKSKGVIDSVLSSLLTKSRIQGHGQSPTHSHGIATGHNLSLHHQPLAVPGTDGCFLFVELLRGRAFIEHLLEDADKDSGGNSATLSFHLSFRQQRFRSKPVTCTSEPDIQEGFLVKLSGEGPEQVSLSSLLATRDPVHLVVVRKDNRSGESRLVSSHFLEWRVALCSPDGRTTLSIELTGVGPEAKMSVGVLDLRLEILPRPTDSLPEDVVSSQMSLERGRTAERDRVFLIYAKQWWREYCQVRDEHSQRLVKLFAHDENGENRFVCAYIRPLRAGRLLESPRQCARFVASIPFERSSTLGTGPKEQWSTGQSFLARNRGDVEDHAVLLCSLLLGFGLDAYVAVGTKGKANQQHAWVVTLQGGTGEEAVFWEAVTGKRYLHKAYRPDRFPEELPNGPLQHPYRTVACLFSHSQFYANNQPTDGVETCVFNMQDEARWKAMSEEAINAVCELHAGQRSPCALITLAPPAIDPVVISNDLEQQLRGLVAECRRERNLSTHWDGQLSYLLTQALAAYELEQVTGVSVGNEEFQAAVHRHVLDGHTFKAYPIQIMHTNAKRGLTSALKSQICQEIVHCRGDHVRFGLRARVYAYAENATATWIMLAATYKSVP